MIRLKKITGGLSLTLLTLSVTGQDLSLRNVSEADGLAFIKKTMPPERLVWLDHSILNLPQNGSINSLALNKEGAASSNAFHPIHLINTPQEKNLLNYSHMKHDQTEVNLKLSSQENQAFLKNRRNVYSAMWAFASLNYIYADLVGVMDVNKLLQYQTGVVEGLKITPEFLTVAAGFMQIPITNVVLPHIIKNEKTLRWVQIVSGAFMSVVQSGTLFLGKPAPYYVLFSAFEIAATTYITIDAIKWKPNSQKQKVVLD